ncbi:hypothetical protein EDD36DRAFT_416233 [Exophiala viscosa]|uniref:CCHC-type domain-containing protein n=1 Tax=Exophiala viscosa TaxID=2486360 RepID=A0AAN6E037_9EURO|nr:hypothetical protein EDD36DRAFT_416233 [Exophiala viscosa]
MTLHSMRSSSTPSRGTGRSSRGSFNAHRGGSSQTAESDQPTCYNCGKPGHMKRECPEPAQQSVNPKAKSALDAASRKVFSLRQNPLDVHLATYESTKSVDKEDSYNIVNGALGIYISQSAFQRLPKGLKVRKARPLRVRLTNGQTTLSTQTVATRLRLGDFRARTELRILEWDVYDVILGYRFESCDSEEWGWKRVVPLHETLPDCQLRGIDEIGLNLSSFREANKILSKWRKRKPMTSTLAESCNANLSALSTAPKLHGRARTLARYAKEKGEPPPEKPRPPEMVEDMTPILYIVRPRIEAR